MVNGVNRREYAVQTREVVVYELPFSVAMDVVEAIVRDSGFRALSMSFAGRWPHDESKPLVRIEAEFAVKI